MPERVRAAPDRAQRAEPAGVQNSRSVNSGSIASAPSMCSTGASAPSASAPSISSTSRQMRTRPLDCCSMRNSSDIMLNTTCCAAVSSTAGGNAASFSAACAGAMLEDAPRGEGTNIANIPPAKPPSCAIGRSSWPLPLPSINARVGLSPPRRWSRKSTSLCPSKIGTRRGDDIGRLHYTQSIRRDCLGACPVYHPRPIRFAMG